MKAAGERLLHPSIAHRNERGRNRPHSGSIEAVMTEGRSIMVTHRLQRIAVHEAGHMAVADHCGVAWRLATIDFEDPNQSSVQFFPRPAYLKRLRQVLDDPRWRDYFERQAQVVLGGYLAERIWVQQWLSPKCAEADFRQVSNLVIAMTGDLNDAKALTVRLFEKVEAELSRPSTWAQVGRYAAVLMGAGRIHWRDRHRIVEVH